MPALAKILSEEEQAQLEMAQVDELSPEYVHDFSNQEELGNVIFRLFAPHAFTARNEYEKKKKERLSREKWLETITQSQASARVELERARKQLFANQAANGGGNGLAR